MLLEKWEDVDIASERPFDILYAEAVKESAEYIRNFLNDAVICEKGWWDIALDNITENKLCLEFGVYDGRSLNDRGDAAAFSAEDKAASAQLMEASTLTGSRDVPVFFQGYAYDADVKNGAISQAREGLTNKGRKFKGEEFTDKYSKLLGQ